MLVADVVGSTAIGEKLGPERSKFLIDEVMRIMSEQVRRYEGTVVQLVGDELLALFGVPVAHEDDAERALRAGLAIQRGLAQYAQEVEAAYGVQLAVRIGVNTGPVVVGVEGDGEDGYDPLTRSATPSTSLRASRRSHLRAASSSVRPRSARSRTASSSRRWARRT